jgi:hypothetical protein
VDWASAYKQDIFLELCLIFGGVISVGIYDRFAKIVLFIVLIQSGMPPSLVVQQIDDVVACGPVARQLFPGQIFPGKFCLRSENFCLREGNICPMVK